MNIYPFNKLGIDIGFVIPSFITMQTVGLHSLEFIQPSHLFAFPIRPGPFQSTVRPGGGVCHTPLGKTAPAADMKFFLYTILEIHIFKATMQSFSSLAIKIWM